MDSQKQVLHFEAKSGFTTAQSNEHQRRWTENGWESANANGRIDRSRVALNFEIVKGGKVQAVDQSRSIPEKFRDNLFSRGIKDPNSGCSGEGRYRTVVDFIISGSHDTLTRLAFGSQDVDFTPGADNGSVKRQPEIEEWAKDMYDVLAGRFGEENILSFIVHLDERSPHIHADIVPVNEQGRISFRSVFTGEDKYEYRRRTLALHDAFAEVNRNWGLRRGDSVAVTHRRHRSTEEYRRELSGECSSLEREAERRSAALKSLDAEIATAARRVKGLTTMVANLEEAKRRIGKEMDAIRSKLSGRDGGESGRDELLREEESLQRKLDDILSSLSDKRGKLEEADRKLADLRARLAEGEEKLRESEERISESEKRQERLRSEVESATSQVSRIQLDRVGSEALWMVLNDFRRAADSLPEESRSRFGDTLISDMASQGMNIIACAALLSMGMVDRATTFAENCGGGGGHSRGDWGRRPDEDEREWLRRCLANSRQMLKPSGRKVRR
ncbi:MAG: plasmid recombination protein [Bacteroidales bacterium]|nr:plasmid recombination protein [Bacteroidales bacterium]